MDIKTAMIETLEDLADKELKQFIWQLCNGVTAGTEPISQMSDREDVVDCMVKQYPEDAGNIMVKTLRNMKQNELAQCLELKLQKGQKPVQEETRNGPVRVQSESTELQPIQSDWLRPYYISPSSRDFKNRLLTQERSEVYIPTSRSQRKGLALLITNIKFDHSSKRTGAELDEGNMEWMLRALGYSVEKHTNLSRKAISNAVENFSKRSEHRDADSTFVVIMSHGTRIQNKDAILGVDYHINNPDDVFFVEDIFFHLNSVNCPALIDKPKVILVQACRGDGDGGVYVRDSVFESDSWVHREKDFVCFMSTLPDVYAYRDPDNGSFFINYIVDVFSSSAHKFDIMEMFRRVALRMQNDPHFKGKQKLLPCIERTTLVKKFYLFPGL